jgi:nucleoside-diphosphate-sugar epimerase
MDRAAKIYVAGHRGMVGSALVRRLTAGGYTNILTRTHAELDLLDQSATREFLTAKSRISSLSRQPRWAVSMPTIPCAPISFTRT